MAKNNLAHRIILPILDLMQTIFSFVYLVPVVMLFGLGKILDNCHKCFEYFSSRFTNINTRS